MPFGSKKSHQKIQFLPFGSKISHLKLQYLLLWKINTSEQSQFLLFGSEISHLKLKTLLFGSKISHIKCQFLSFGTIKSHLKLLTCCLRIVISSPPTGPNPSNSASFAMVHSANSLNETSKAFQWSELFSRRFL